MKTEHEFLEGLVDNIYQEYDQQNPDEVLILNKILYTIIKEIKNRLGELKNVS